MVYLKMKSFDNGKPILFGLNRMATPYSVSMSDTGIRADANGKKYVQEGMFVVSATDSIRFLPRAILGENITANTTTTFGLKNPTNMFKVGDVLYPVGCYAEVVISGTPAEGDVVTLNINGINYSVTADATPTITELVNGFATSGATWLALSISNMRTVVKGTASNGVFSIWAPDSYAISAYSSSSALQVRVVTTDPGYFGDHLVPVGTILSFSEASNPLYTNVTLAGAPTYNIYQNARLGVRVEQYLGIYPDPLDFTDEPVMHIAPIAECDGVYEQNLPYVDEQLKRVFNKLNINKRFYKKYV